MTVMVSSGAMIVIIASVANVFASGLYRVDAVASHAGHNGVAAGTWNPRAAIDLDTQSLVAARGMEIAIQEHEFYMARTLVVVASIGSLCCSLVMVWYFITFQESRRGGRRVLFCLHVADIGAAMSWLLIMWLPAHAVVDTDTTEPEKDSPVDAIFDRPASAVCLTQGYLLLFFMLASYLWTACFAFHLYQILGRRSKYPELYEYRYHLIAWGIPVTTVIHLGMQHLGGFGLIGESGRPWCWLRTYNDYHWSRDGFFIQLSAFYGPVTLVFLHNLAVYINLLYRMSDILSTSTEGRIWHRMMAYTWVFFLGFVWAAFGFVFQAASTSHELSPAMLYLMSFFTPLQGVMNAVAYGLNRKMLHRSRTAISQAFKSS